MQLGTDDNIKYTLSFIGSTSDSNDTNYLTAVIIQLLDRIYLLERGSIPGEEELSYRPEGTE